MLRSHGSRFHQRCDTVGILLIDVGTPIDQAFGCLEMILPHCPDQCCCPIIVCRIDIGARIEQYVNGSCVPFIGSDKQRTGSVLVLCLYCGSP